MQLKEDGKCRARASEVGMLEESSLAWVEVLPGLVREVSGYISERAVVLEDLMHSVHCGNLSSTGHLG